MAINPFMTEAQVLQKIRDYIDGDLKVEPIPTLNTPLLPEKFMKQYRDMDKDLEVVVVGDSLVAGVTGQDTNPQVETSLPGWTHDHWTFRLWDNICFNHPTFRRFDYDGFFNSVGLWEYIDSGKLNSTPTSASGEYSTTSGTFMSDHAQAEVTFNIDTGEYEKFNIVHGLHPDGCDAVEVGIAEGNGFVEVSTDKTTWIEANGFVTSQKTVLDGNIAVTGQAMHQRHRRIWMRTTGTTGELTISLKKTSEDASFLYFWGVEMWNGNTLLLTNLGRGGRDIDLLNRNITDVFDRNPDLVIISMPYANDEKDSYQEALTNYHKYFLEDDSQSTYYNRSYRQKSNTYQDVSTLILRPSGRKSHWDGNNIVHLADIPLYTRGKRTFQYLIDNIPQNTSFIDIYDRFYVEARSLGLTMEEAMSAGQFTVDGTHYNQTGSDLYFKYLKGMFL